MEHALITNELSKAVVLANCYVNKCILNCGYSPELEVEIKKNCPIILKNGGLRVPEFYENFIKSKIGKY